MPRWQVEHDRSACRQRSQKPFGFKEGGTLHLTSRSEKRSGLLGRVGNPLLLESYILENHGPQTVLLEAEQDQLSIPRITCQG